MKEEYLVFLIFALVLILRIINYIEAKDIGDLRIPKALGRQVSMDRIIT